MSSRSPVVSREVVVQRPYCHLILIAQVVPLWLSLLERSPRHTLYCQVSPRPRPLETTRGRDLPLTTAALKLVTPYRPLATTGLGEFLTMATSQATNPPSCRLPCPSRMFLSQRAGLSLVTKVSLISLSHLTMINPWMASEEIALVNSLT